VKYLQVFLISKGYLAPGNDIGFYGKLTESAVKSFQKAEGLISSGSPSTTGYGAVGPRTRTQIFISYGASADANRANTANTTSTGSGSINTSGKVSLTRNLSYGSQGSDVTALQNFLIAKGYLAPGNAIGFFGKLTESAVKS
jgi:peptidoglycan hydrolase-like protein with peptidoglycan-binding domain